MIAEWLEATGIGGSSGLASADGHAPVVTCGDGVLRVDGTFDSLRLYDLAGNMVAWTTDDVVETDKLTPGVYVVRLSDGQGESAGQGGRG